MEITVELSGAAPPTHRCAGLSQLFPNVLIVPASCCPWSCSGPSVSRKWMNAPRATLLHGGWVWGPQRSLWPVSQTISIVFHWLLLPHSEVTCSLTPLLASSFPASTSPFSHWAFYNHHPNQLLASLLLGRIQDKAEKCGRLVFGRKYKLH